jgi:2-polyprenyl-3-methyl-5-hydroxy-6-metoxy-1,4-benzoquinol methylase
MTETEQFWSDWYAKKTKHESDKNAAGRTAQYIYSLIPDFKWTQSRVMEIGCFDGTLTQVLAQQEPALLTGVDVCAHGIEKAKQMNMRDNVAFKVWSPTWDRANEEVAEQSQDMIILAQMCQYIPVAERESYVKACLRYLKPDGVLLFIGLPEAWFFDQFFARKLASDKIRDELRKVFELTHTFTKDGMKDLAEKCGLDLTFHKLPINLQTDETQNLFDAVATHKSSPMVKAANSLMGGLLGFFRK